GLVRPLPLADPRARWATQAITPQTYRRRLYACRFFLFGSALGHLDVLAGGEQTSSRQWETGGCSNHSKRKPKRTGAGEISPTRTVREPEGASRLRGGSHEGNPASGIRSRRANTGGDADQARAAKGQESNPSAPISLPRPRSPKFCEP